MVENLCKNLCHVTLDFFLKQTTFSIHILREHPYGILLVNKQNCSRKLRMSRLEKSFDSAGGPIDI